MVIRPFHFDELDAAHQVRLTALQESPDAYGTSYAEEAEATEQWKAARYGQSDDRVAFGAFHADGRAVGLAILSRQDRVKTRHKANVQGVYVLPDYRGQGLGRKLMRAMTDHARTWDGVEILQLGVLTTNAAGIHLYESLGYKTYSHERHCHKVGDRYNDLYMMEMFL